MPLPWYRRLFSCCYRPAVQPAKPRRFSRATHFRPMLEMLEERVVLDVSSVHAATVWAIEGGPVFNQVVADFKDTGVIPGVTDKHYSIAINWGDGTTTQNADYTGSSSFDMAAGAYVFTGQVRAGHLYTESGPFVAQVTVQETPGFPFSSGQPLSSQAQVFVNTFAMRGEPVPLRAVEGQPFYTDLVGRFFDAGGRDGDTAEYTASVRIDGTPVQARIAYLGGDTYGVYATNNGAIPNLIDVSVRNVFDGQTVLFRNIVDVADPAVIAAGSQTITAVEGLNTGLQTVATFTDPGGAENPANIYINDGYQQVWYFPPSQPYTATINWGDGKPATSGTITLSNGVFTVQGSHTYDTESGGVPYQITVTIYYDATPPAVVCSTATVSDSPPVANADTAATNENRAVVIPVLANDTVAPSDAPLRVNSVSTPAVAGSSVAITSAGTVTYTPAVGFTGTDTFTYTVLDKDGAVSQPATVTVTVAAINTVPGTQTVQRKSALAFSAANGNGISLALLGADPAVDQFQVTLTVTRGSLALGSTNGLASVSGNNTSTITLTGTLNALNAALNGLTYFADPGFTGAVTFTMQTSDAAGNLLDTDGFTINVIK